MSDIPVPARRIAAYRRTRKMTKKAVAAGLGLKDVRELNRIEEGRQKVAAPQLAKAMDLFGTTLEEMTDPFRLDPGEGQWSFRVREPNDEQPIGEDA